MDDPQQKARKHEPHGRFGIDAGPADAGRVEVGQLRARPAQVEGPVDTGKDVIVANKITRRAAQKEPEPAARPPADHATLRTMPPKA